MYKQGRLYLADQSASIGRRLGPIGGAGHTPEEAASKFSALLAKEESKHASSLPKSVDEALKGRLVHDDSGFARRQLADIEAVYGDQPELLAAVRRHGGGAHIHANKSIGSNPGFGFLERETAPSSYKGSGISKLSDAGGVYAPLTHALAINGSVPSGSAAGVGPHEFGHMVDHALGRKDGGGYFSDHSTGMEEAAKGFKALEHDRDKKLLHPHYTLNGAAGRHELFAESFPAYLRARKNGTDPKIAMTEGLGTFATSDADYRALKNSTAMLFLERTYDKLMEEVNSGQR